jgi:fatty acid desaturase
MAAGYAIRLVERVRMADFRGFFTPKGQAGRLRRAARNRVGARPAASKGPRGLLPIIRSSRCENLDGAAGAHGGEAETSQPGRQRQMESTTKFEAEVARRHSPEIAWPTIVLAIGCLALWALSSGLALAGDLPLWAAMAINTIAMYAIYTPVHDSSHSAIVPRRKRWRWLNRLIGTISAFPIFMYYDHHRKSHYIHHARTNRPEDPDTFAMGSFAEVFFVKTPWSLLNYLNGVALYRDCRALKLTDRELILTMVQYALTLALLVGIVAAGYGFELLALWIAPWFVGVLLMQVAFGWFPHHDHSETGRYRDTRISLFPGADLLYLQQNLHLIHHMLPVVPFYRYRAVFDELRPTLERHGARIEGFWPYSRPTAA